MTVVGTLLRLATDIVEGSAPDPVVIAKTLMGAALEFAPVDTLKQYLTEEAIRRDNEIADAAQRAKFGG